MSKYKQYTKTDLIIMKRRIKKFNELFDTDELKAENEISLLQGNLLSGELRAVRNNKYENSDLYDIHGKLLYNFPWISELDQREIPGYDDMIFYSTTNEHWYISLSILVKGESCGFGIMYRLRETEIIKNGTNISHSLAYSGSDKVYFSEWDKLDSNELIKYIKVFFEPLLNRLGFKEVLGKGNIINRRRFN